MRAGMRHAPGIAVGLGLALLGIALLSCSRPAAPPPGAPAPASVVAAAMPALTDPPRRPGKPLAMVVMPDSPSFRTVRRALVNEVKQDLDIATFVIDARTSAADFTAKLTESGAAAVVLMDNPTVKLYRAYQNRGPDKRGVVPAVVVMTSFLEELKVELSNASGVAYEVPGVLAFVQLRSVIEKPVSRVGVVHRAAFGPFIARQKILAAKEQITLIPVEVPVDANATDVKSALGKLARADIDALWVLNDNGLLRDAAFLERAWRQHILAMGVPVVVGVPTLVSAEARFGTFAVLPDLDALGVQAADVLLDVADNEWRADDRAVELPVSTKTVVNMRQVRERFGLREGALRRIDRAVE